MSMMIALVPSLPKALHSHVVDKRAVRTHNYVRCAL